MPHGSRYVGAILTYGCNSTDYEILFRFSLLLCAYIDLTLFVFVWMPHRRQ